MHSTASSKPVALRFKSLALVAVLLPSATVEAGGLMPALERAGRFFGVGYSDGYHVCKPDYESPCADLPIRREQESCLDAVGNHGRNECDACGLQTEIVECEGGSCFKPHRSDSNCDQPSCDAASCDGPACYATAPFPAYASMEPKASPVQTVRSVNVPVAQPEFSPTQFIEPQVATESDVAEKSQSISLRQSSEIEPQQSVLPSRLARSSGTRTVITNEFGHEVTLNPFVSNQVASEPQTTNTSKPVSVSQSQVPPSQSSIERSRMIRPIKVVQETAAGEPIQK